jgi:hypothetical protein
MKLFQSAKNAVGVFIVTSVTAAGSALAALDTEVTTAITAGKTDALALGALVIAVIIGIAALKWLRKAL